MQLLQKDSTNNLSISKRSLTTLALASFLVACGGGSSGGGSDSSEPGGNNPNGNSNGGNGNTTAGKTEEGIYEISGSISGLTGSLELINTHNQEVLTVTGNSFAFGQKLAEQEEYQVTLAKAAEGQQICQVDNGAGQATANITDIAIVCRDWQSGAKQLSGNSEHGLYPQLTRVGDDIYAQWHADLTSLKFLNRHPYNSQTGWSSESGTIIDQYNSYSLVGNSAGESMLVFEDLALNRAGTHLRLRGATDMSHIGFTSGPRTSDYAMDIDEQGNVLLVWSQVSNGSTNEVSLYYRYFNGSAWNNAAIAETNTSGSVKNPVVKFTSPGKAIVAWEFGAQSIANTSYDGLRVANFDVNATSRWSSDEAIDVYTGSCGRIRENSVEIHITENNTPAISWIEGVGNCNAQTPVQISYLADGDWSAPIKVIDQGYTTSAKVVTLDDDNVLVAYSLAGKFYAKECNVKAKTCSDAALVADAAGTLEAIAKDNQNNIVLAWSNTNNGKDLYTNRYDALNDHWSEPLKLNTEIGRNIDIGFNGEEFVVLWTEKPSNYWMVFAKVHGDH